MSDEQLTTKKLETVVSAENPATIETPSRVCNARCRICNSLHLKAIHDLKNAGHTYDDIVKIVRDKLKFEVSKSSISRHFTNYQKQRDLISAQLINDDLIEEATKQAAHTKQLVSLIDQAFKMIGAQIDAGLIRFDVSDLEKLMKLRYQVMSGQDADENDVLAIFQKASDKYGLDLQQGILFKPAKKVDVDISPPLTGQRADCERGEDADRVPPSTQ